jgi:(1->4)-alpha-D-glucan 1-alpha-D-glucosylmutase
MSAPRATMRLQLNRDFTFDAVARLAPYLAAIGVSHLYCSPILMARAGSGHGYDVIDPTHINPELGGEAGFRRLVAALRRKQLGIIVDIVPNHMAVGPDNPWWGDVLRHGQNSRYARFFDIEWDTTVPRLKGKVLLPILGQPYGAALSAGELKITRNASGSDVSIQYYRTKLPLSPATANEVQTRSPADYDAATPGGRARLHRLLERQHYRLAWWRVASDCINWRRFFDINDLVALRMEDETVFEETHALLLRLYGDGMIDGFRVDHVDGLSEPAQYCRRLRSRLNSLAAARPSDAPPDPAYVVVEKILGPGETLGVEWNIDGTAGYDFMEAASAVLHDCAGAAPLVAFWADISSRPGDFRDEEIAARREILDRSFGAQLASVAMALHRIAQRRPSSWDTSYGAIVRSITTLLAHMRVYRTYIDSSPQAAQTVLSHVLADVRRRVRGDQTALHAVAEWLLHPTGELGRIASRRFEQLSVSVAAKAVEDTALYRYGCLLSRNDVGSDPAHFASTSREFHADCVARAARFPAAMLATATHDHKRGEDVRARLAVLSEMPMPWADHVHRWMKLNTSYRTGGPGAWIPSPGDEVMLYQMTVGAWPPTLAGDDHRGCEELIERLVAWLIKAIREAKLRTSWTDPDLEYEKGAAGFVRAVLGRESQSRPDIVRFAQRIAPAGAVNGLTQTLLKLTVPGVPDFYQGTELWDQSLVDPDNRRPVDFASRVMALRQKRSAKWLLETWRTGEIKQTLIACTLAHRATHSALYAAGAYVPVPVHGERADHVIAFLRSLGSELLLVIVPRLPFGLLCSGDSIIIPPEAWGETHVLLPPEAALVRLRNVFTGTRCGPFGECPNLTQILTDACFGAFATE